MAEPTTAAVIGGLLIKSAVERIGSRIGDAIADGIFGKSTDLQDIQDDLRRIANQLQEVLHYSRATYALVEKLPDIVEELVDQQTLHVAHSDIQSAYEGYLHLKEWHGMIGYDTMVKLLGAWNIIVDKESSTERLVNLPRYAEFILLVTHGHLYTAIQQGIEFKLDTIKNSISAIEKDEITSCAHEIEYLLSSPQIKTGALLDGSPWVSWVVHGHRTHAVQHCHVQTNGRITCYYTQVPDTAWNNATDKKNARLQILANKMEELTCALFSMILAREILARYLSALESIADLIEKTPHVSVIETVEPFPAANKIK